MILKGSISARLDRVFGVHSVAGRLEKKTNGLVRADACGIPLRRVEFARNAFTSGLRPSVYRVRAGRCIPTGTYIDSLAPIAYQ